MFKYMIQEFNKDDRDYRRFFQSRNVSLPSFNRSKSLNDQRKISGKKNKISENSFFPIIAKKMFLTLDAIPGVHYYYYDDFLK